jgi:hypothetical protein
MDLIFETLIVQGIGERDQSVEPIRECFILRRLEIVIKADYWPPGKLTSASYMRRIA